MADELADSVKHNSRFMVAPTKAAIFWNVGGTPAAILEEAAASGASLPSHHSPLFRISPAPAVRMGVESSVVALLELMGD